MDKLILAAVCLVLGAALLTGKGTRLIAGKKAEKNEGYNLGAISRMMGIVLLAAAVCFLGIYLTGVFRPKLLTAAQSIFGLILAALGIFSILFINKSPRFRA
ncbi:MAG: DUF3784 domain-containing protein [Oscillospiraceae bacterium]|jgi:drug/metabolite transporter (DMT)-like permease|nr:DUF3784 domain-containing protein [Oscillospiraceae bacterium]MCI1989961.1 DUF3784 domain-containing protein [Oscillospiraceae bacterium]MCI2034991.1 DUF3784 domain-containing protein [Oscillospiraceae bacterium]